jgi:regulator of protease activity HflC (stomatin/prohibitin superfamily)
MKYNKYIASIVLALFMIFTTGCSTKVVPPGTTVIVLKSSGDSTIYTKGSYLAWGRDRVYFVDTKLKAFPEPMKVLCTDNINMQVDVKWIGSFSVTKSNIKIIKEKVPAVKVENGDIKGYQLSLDKFYKTAMRDIIRSTARKIIAKYSTEEVRENRDEIEQAIRTKVINKFQTLGYPIVTTDVMIANLDYPPEVTAQRKAIKNAQLEDEKQAALAKAAIQQAKREAGIAREKGKAQIERAKADALANKIRSESLTPAIIQMRMWDTLQAIGGREGDLMIVPYDALNSVLTPAVNGKTVMRELSRPEG